MRISRLVPFALIAGLMSSGMNAQTFQKPEEAIKYRRSSFTLMGVHFASLGAMAYGRIPFDPQAAERNAKVVATISQLPFNAFVPGSDKGETRAKPEIWADQAAFERNAANMQSAVRNLSAVAKTGNLDAMRAAFGTAAQTCKACHDGFRKD